MGRRRHVPGWAGTSRDRKGWMMRTTGFGGPGVITSRKSVKKKPERNRAPAFRIARRPVTDRAGRSLIGETNYAANPAYRCTDSRSRSDAPTR